MRAVSIALLAALCTFRIAWSAECGDLSTQAAMNQCASDELTVQDKALNDTYKQVMINLDPDKQQKLKLEQRAWIAKRDKTCKAAVAGMEGASMYSLLMNSCLSDETKKRTSELTAMAK